MDPQTHALAQEQAEICKVFGNANRVLILWVLGGQEMSVSAVAEAIDSSLQNTSQHLRLMKDKGILKSRKEGHTVYYRIGANRLMAGCRILQRATQEMPL